MRRYAPSAVCSHTAPGPLSSTVAHGRRWAPSGASTCRLVLGSKSVARACPAAVGGPAQRQAVRGGSARPPAPASSGGQRPRPSAAPPLPAVPRRGRP
eukprot:14184497-Alexandrium_andersonii.AAC.1